MNLVELAMAVNAAVLVILTVSVWMLWRDFHKVKYDIEGLRKQFWLLRDWVWRINKDWGWPGDDSKNYTPLYTVHKFPPPGPNKPEHTMDQAGNTKGDE